jgi:SAM-dependent methyltransferase
MSAMSIEGSTPSLANWFETSLGQYLLSREQGFFDQAVADVFGFNALQLGLIEHDFLRASRIPYRFSVSPHPGAKLRAEFIYLPISNGSIDLAVLPHVLEFTANPHQVLREIERVLVPEGQVIIVSFNPWSLWGMRRAFNGTRDEYPWCGRFITLPRLKDWLALLGLEVNAGRVGCYLPPINREVWLQRLRFMDMVGDRWWPFGGGVYFLQAVKRVAGMRVIVPAWRDRPAPKKHLAPAPRKVSDRDDGAVQKRKAS